MRGWADLDQVRVPRVLGDADVVVALFLAGRQLRVQRVCVCVCVCSPHLLGALAKDVAWLQSVAYAQLGRPQEHARYLEALTKRPAMVAVCAWAGGCGREVREDECSP